MAEAIKDNFKSYTEQVSFNNIPCNEGETLAPVVAAGEMKEMLKLKGLDPKNVRSWKFPHAKKVVPVAFIQVRIDEMENAVKYFNKQVNTYLNGERNPFNGMLSIEEMLEKQDDGDENGFDPTAVCTAEEDRYALFLLDDLVDHLNSINPLFGKAFLLIYYGRDKGVAAEVFGGKKSRSYEKVNEVLRLAAEFYNRYNQD